MTDISNTQKIQIISDSLAYMRRYHGKTVVVKYGGNAMINESLKAAFASDIHLLTLVGIRPIIVHGGGPQISQTLAQAGIESRFVDGLRYTDAATMEVVEMVLGGQINKHIVGLINECGGNAIGLTGKDGHLLRARRLQRHTANGAEVDIGLVGKVSSVNTMLLSLLEENRFVPIIAPMGIDDNGQTLNINSDTTAAAIAIATSAEALFLLTNTAGVLDAQGNTLKQLGIAEARRCIDEGTISGGMKPKVECAIEAITSGVRSCQIIDGTIKNALLLEIFSNEGAGTFISA